MLQGSFPFRRADPIFPGMQTPITQISVAERRLLFDCRKTHLFFNVCFGRVVALPIKCAEAAAYSIWAYATYHRASISANRIANAMQWVPRASPWLRDRERFLKASIIINSLSVCASGLKWIAMCWQHKTPCCYFCSSTYIFLTALRLVHWYLLLVLCGGCEAARTGKTGDIDSAYFGDYLPTSLLWWWCVCIFYYAHIFRCIDVMMCDAFEQINAAQCDV